jgi:hypothetical protein
MSTETSDGIAHILQANGLALIKILIPSTDKQENTQGPDKTKQKKIPK